MQKLIRDFAKQLRKDMPDAEKKLWGFLRARQLMGFKFRRQHPVGKFITDFCCLEKMMIVELDGGQHGSASGRSADDKRTQFLESLGFRVLRFWDNEVLGNAEGVLAVIMDGLNPSSRLLPKGEKGKSTE